MRTDDFDYELPRELIAQAPVEPRDSCRLLVLHRQDGSIEHKVFTNVIDYLDPGDLLVVNTTRVMPARLIGTRPPAGGEAETLLLRELPAESQAAGGHAAVWECIVRPGRRLQPGKVIEYRAGGLHASPAAPVILRGTVCGFGEQRGMRLVKFEPAPGLTLDEAIHQVGNVPLPPYIKDYEGDPELYQTVYAMDDERSAAAPTAGLHFTPGLIAKIRVKGIDWATVELEVGIDTFRLVEEDDPTQHQMHTERYHVSQQVVDQIHACRARGGRVVAVGTTTVRSLESAWDACAVAADGSQGDIVARSNAATSLFLLPGSQFHVVDAMITNFHVPRSTLMMMVSAFATREQIMEAYRQAVEQRYRMLSFGDAMLMV